MRMVKRRAEQRFHADLTALGEPRRTSGRDLLGRPPSWTLRGRLSGQPKSNARLVNIFQRLRQLCFGDI